MLTCIKNAKVFTPYRMIGQGYVLFEGKTVLAVGAGEPKLPAACEVLDAKGAYISPGFIDIHTHGGAGHDFMEGTVEAFLKPVRMHLEHGTTTILPTTMTSTNEDLKKTFAAFEEAKRHNRDGAFMPGLHLEGPYFNYEMRGAQDPRFLKDPDPDEYRQFLDWSGGCIARWSIAPELPGALLFGRTLRDAGILVAMAHTNAVYEQAAEAFENGFTLLTHFYSAMSGVRRINAYRYGGVVETGYLIDELDVEIIADGKHLPPMFLQLIHKHKRAEHIALITDSLRPAGTDVSESISGSLENGQRIIIEDGVAKLPDRTAFAGSIATTDRLVRTIRDSGVPLLDAVKMATATPARILGLSGKGVLAPGKDADILMFDDDIRIQRVYLGGELKYNKA